MKKLIPSFLTILNLVCGCLAIALAFQFQFEAVLILVCLGVFFDFLDGWRSFVFWGRCSRRSPGEHPKYQRNGINPIGYII